MDIPIFKKVGEIVRCDTVVGGAKVVYKRMVTPIGV